MDSGFYSRSARTSPVGRERTPTPEFQYPPPLPSLSPDRRFLNHHHLHDFNADVSADLTSHVPLLRKVLLACRSCQQRMQVAADVLLGADDVRRSLSSAVDHHHQQQQQVPITTSTSCTLNRSMGRCRDRVLGASRQLTSALRSLTALLLAGLAHSKETCVCLEEVADTVERLADICTNAAYVQTMQQHGETSKRRLGLTPVGDQYALGYAVSDIERRVNALHRLNAEDATGATLADIRHKIVDCVRVLDQASVSMANQAGDDQSREQLRLALKSVGASSDALVAVLKPTGVYRSKQETLACSQSLGDALVSAGNALVTVASVTHNSYHRPSLSVAPPGMKRNQSSVISSTNGSSSRPSQQAIAVLTAAVSMVTPCILVCDVVRVLAQDADDPMARAKAQSCLTVVAKGSVKLAAALGVTVIDITTTTNNSSS